MGVIANYPKTYHTSTYILSVINNCPIELEARVNSCLLPVAGQVMDPRGEPPTATFLNQPNF